MDMQEFVEALDRVREGNWDQRSQGISQGKFPGRLFFEQMDAPPVMNRERCPPTKTQTTWQLAPKCARRWRTCAQRRA
jgi:hypothetical protein